MAIQAIVFDIGGVLEYTPPTGWIARWTERLGRDVLDIFVALDKRGLDGSIGTCTMAEWLTGLGEVSGMDQTQTDEFMADLWEEYLGTLNVELMDYIRGLRPTYKLGILSNSFLGAREKEQAAYGFEDLFDPIIYSHEVGLAKPDPEIYKLTCERLQLRPEEIIFVDDVGENIEGANNFGIHGVYFKDNAQTIEEIESLLN